MILLMMLKATEIFSFHFYPRVSVVALDSFAENDIS